MPDTPFPANAQPDAQGFFGAYGGRYVPETLVGPLEQLAGAYDAARLDPSFQAELDDLLATYVGRATPLTHAKRLSAHLGGDVWLKREDLLHTGAHKINNALGQGLLALRMGKTRLLAETGAGQHGVATATAAALLGLKCTVYMGAVDMARQKLNVFRMRLLGAEVKPVTSGAQTLKDATSEAMRTWVGALDECHFVVGSALGPHPYPTIVRDFHKVIGIEARRQMLAQAGRLPDAIFACVGGGSNAIGIFHAFLADTGVRLIGAEAGGHGRTLGEHAARFDGGRPGILHGTYSWLLQDGEGQVLETHSISAGLDYAMVGPEHAFLREAGRAEYVHPTDAEALAAAMLLARLEGIIPALESAHGLAALVAAAPQMQGQTLLVNVSGRGDKDIDIYRENLPELDQ